MFQELIQLQTIGAMETPTYQSLTLMVNTIQQYTAYHIGTKFFLKIYNLFEYLILHLPNIYENQQIV